MGWWLSGLVGTVVAVVVLMGGWGVVGRFLVRGGLDCRIGFGFGFGFEGVVVVPLEGLEAGRTLLCVAVVDIWALLWE